MGLAWVRCLATLCLFVTLAPSCSRPTATKEKEGGRSKEIVFPVEVKPVELRRVDYTVSGIGALEAFENVQITARVAGVVERLHFKEGDSVKEGALLAEVEPQRYQLAVASTQASLERAQAARAEGERELERAQKLAAEGVSTSAEVNTWQTKLTTARAQESEARAALGVASLNLRDARIKAPLGGSIQSRNVQTGQYVQAGTVIATLIRRDPLLLRFKVTESEAGRLRPGMIVNFTVSGSSQKNTAKITFVAGTAESSSRMVPIVAEVSENPELRPGAFTEVTVPVGTNAAALAISEMAIRPTERGFVSFVVENGVAEERIVELGLRTPDGLVEVLKGLRAGEMLVVRGGEALRQGAKVRVSTPRPGASATPSARLGAKPAP